LDPPVDGDESDDETEGEAVGVREDREDEEEEEVWTEPEEAGFAVGAEEAWPDDEEDEDEDDESTEGVEGVESVSLESFR